MSKQDNEYFEQHVFVCINQRDSDHATGCCFSKGATDFHTDLKAKIKQTLKEKNIQNKVRVSKSGCLGRCSEGPVAVVYPQSKWFTEFDCHDNTVVKDAITNEVIEYCINNKS